ELLAIPVLPLDPFVASDQVEIPPGNRAGFTGLLGVADAFARQALPINFAKPKEPKAPENPNKKRNLVRVAAAAILLLAAIVVIQLIVSESGARAEELRDELAKLEARRAKLRPDAARIEALGKWQNSNVSYLDEVYDLVAFFADKPG